MNFSIWKLPPSHPHPTPHTAYRNKQNLCQLNRESVTCCLCQLIRESVTRLSRCQLIRKPVTCLRLQVPPPPSFPVKPKGTGKGRREGGPREVYGTHTLPSLCHTHTLHMLHADVHIALMATQTVWPPAHSLSQSMGRGGGD